MKIKFIFILLFLFFAVSLNGQEETIYIYHQATEGENMKSLEKIYGVSQEDIKNANPTLKWTLKSGESVRIPYKKTILSTNKTETTQAATPSISKNEPIDTQFYEVSPKETLYGISKKFNISIEALKAANPILKDGLKIGQKIIIPDESFFQNNSDAENIISPFHIVKSGETMYSIAKLYRTNLDSLQFYNNHIINYNISIGDTLQIPTYINKTDYIEHKTQTKEKLTEIAFKYQTSINELKEANQNLPNKVQKGKTVIIPVTPYEAIEDDDKELYTETPSITSTTDPNHLLCVEKWNSEAVFKIALMLPLYINELTTTTFNNITHKTTINDYPFFNFFQFYQSGLLALKELQKNNLHFELYVYDINNDKSKLDQILQKNELKQMDLIIGIMYKESFIKVAEFAKIHDITLINVNSNRDEILNGYPNIVKITPSQDLLAKAAVSVLPDKLESYNLIFSHKKDASLIEEEKLLFNAFSDKYNNSQYIDETFKQSSNIIKNLDKTKPNYIIAINNNPASIMDLLRILDKEREKYEIHVIGYPEWDEISILDIDHVQNLNTIFFSPFFVDYTNDDVINFVQKFRLEYNTEPDIWAFEGYDIFSYFIEGLAKYGKNFMPCSNSIKYQPMTTKYQFKNSLNTGYSNNWWNIYTIKNYKRVRLND